jgi:hypothetical protein
MNSDWQIPRFPGAKSDFEKEHINKVLALLEHILRIMREPGTVRAANLNISNLPTTSTGLEAGDVWNDTGTLKIV